jgi:hypothetical protein
MAGAEQPDARHFDGVICRASCPRTERCIGFAHDESDLRPQAAISASREVLDRKAAAAPPNASPGPSASDAEVTAPLAGAARTAGHRYPAHEIAGSKPGVGSGSNALLAGAKPGVGSGSNALLAGAKPGVGSGSNALRAGATPGASSGTGV